MPNDSFVGKLASGKRVYVKRLKGDESGLPITHAVFVDWSNDGKLRLVSRFHSSPTSTDSRTVNGLFCANGMEHSQGLCNWTKSAEPIPVETAAKWNAHWWEHVGNHYAEVVELKPVAYKVNP